MEQLHYDLDLFIELNKQYAQTSTALAQVAATVQIDVNRFETAASRIAQVNKDLNFESGMRVLEIGCGRGHMSSVLKRDYGCEVVGLDIRRYPEWHDFLSAGLDLRIHDISQMKNDELGTFDRIVSLAVWEHMEHPYSALTAVKDLLNSDGESLAYISANLHRGPKASHRYREVFFPWPHLLFDDDVFVQFYQGLAQNNVRAAWVNKLTVAHYEKYVRQLEFDVVKQWTTGTPIDEILYERFIDKLGRYPRYDLEQNMLYMVLGRQALQPDTKRQIAALKKRMEISVSEATELRQCIQATRASVAFRAGSALVAAFKNPLQAWRLPGQMWRIYKSSGSRSTDQKPWMAHR